MENLIEAQKKELAQSRKILTDMFKDLKTACFQSKMMQTLMLDLLDLAQMENRALRINNEYFNIN